MMYFFLMAKIRIFEKKTKFIMSFLALDLPHANKVFRIISKIGYDPAAIRIGIDHRLSLSVS